MSAQLGDASATIAYVEAITAGRLSSEIIVDRGCRRTLRTTLPDGRPVVIKLWNLRGFKGALRRHSRRTKGRSEWTVGRAMRLAGVPVPMPLAWVDLSRSRTEFHECVVFEYVESSTCGSLAVHRAVKAGDEPRWTDVSRQVIEITRLCIAAGLYDSDHRLSNFLVGAGGTVFRMDFENAVVLKRVASPRELGTMLGGLIASYAFLARPRAGVAEWFVAWLFKECRIESKARHIALRQAEQEVSELIRRTGLDVPFDQSRVVID